MRRWLCVACFLLLLVVLLSVDEGETSRRRLSSRRRRYALLSRRRNSSSNRRQTASNTVSRSRRVAVRRSSSSYVPRRRSSLRRPSTVRRRGYLRRPSITRRKGYLRRPSITRRRGYLRRPSITRRRGYLRRRSVTRRHGRGYLRPKKLQQQRPCTSQACRAGQGGLASPQCVNSASQLKKNGRYCVCRSGRWFCCRLRREITHMPAADQEAYFRAYITVTTQQQYRSIYRNLMASHRRNFDSVIHDRSQFLPWHRWYLLQMENLLRRVNSSVTLPYFDWSAHSHKPWSASVWSANLLGGNGVCSSGRCCIENGQFRRNHWKTSLGRCLERNFSGTLPDMPAVQLLVDIPMSGFNAFETALRGTFHDGPHCAFGGTMCSESSAEAPEFFLHHAFVDSIWWRWQTRSPAHRRHFFYGSRSRLLAAGQAVAHDYHDLEKMPGNVAVCYEGEGQGLVSLSNDTVSRAQRRLGVLPPKQILQIPRLRYTSLSQRSEALRLFHVRPQDAKAMLRYDKILRGRHRPSSLQLQSGIDRMTGFATEAVAGNRISSRH